MVVIIVDTLRADHVYGDRARTPNMDALARDGLRFTRMFPEAMPTVPARNSILLGRRIFPFRGWHGHRGMVREPGWSPVGDPGDAFTSVLRRHGYWTAYVTDNPFLGFAPGYRRLRRSFDRFDRRGGQAGGQGRGVSERELRHWLHPAIEDAESRERLRKFLGNANDYAHNERRSFAARVFRDATALLDVARRNRPFAMVVDTFEPHEPWTPPRSYINLYGDPDYRGREPSKPYYAPVARYLSGGQGAALLRRMRALYAAEVTMTDRWLGVFLDRLHKLRLDRDTIVVLTSDHGFLLGDHGWTGKSPTQLHPALIRVPLTIVHPDGRRRGDSTRFFAQSHDIAPTILSLADVRCAAADDRHGPRSAVPGTAAEQALLRLRGLHQRLLHPHRPLGAVRQQPRAQHAPVRPRARSTRAAQPGFDPAGQGAPAVQGGEPASRRAAALLPQRGIAARQGPHL